MQVMLQILQLFLHSNFTGKSVSLPESKKILNDEQFWSVNAPSLNSF
jgi:hypothetical protein